MLKYMLKNDDVVIPEVLELDQHCVQLALKVLICCNFMDAHTRDQAINVDAQAQSVLS